jgi:hypothetical protein
MMKRTAVLFVIILAVTVAEAFQEAGGWTKFESAAGSFSVLVPALPTEQKETKDSPHGPYTTTLFISRGSGETYMAGFVDYDAKYNFDVQKELEANRDNFANAVKGTVKSTTKITFKGNPGIEFDGTTPDYAFRSRVYIVGRRPYMLIAAFPAGAESSPTINKYLSSFDLKSK